jgi:hypothetical protein
VRRDPHGRRRGRCVAAVGIEWEDAAVRRGPVVEIELGDTVEGDRSRGARAHGCTYAEQASRIHSATMKLENFRVEGATPSKKSTSLVGPVSSLPLASRVGFRCVPS